MIFIGHLHILYWMLVDIGIRRVSNPLWSAREAWVSSSSLGPTAGLFKPIWIHTCFSFAILLFSQVPRLRPISASYLPIVFLIRIDFLKLCISLKLRFLSLRSPSGIQGCGTRKMAGRKPTSQQCCQHTCASQLPPSLNPRASLLDSGVTRHFVW